MCLQERNGKGGMKNNIFGVTETRWKKKKEVKKLINVYDMRWVKLMRILKMTRPIVSRLSIQSLLR